MNLPPDIHCRACQIAAGGHGCAVDYWCADCCIRLLARMKSREMVGGMLRSIERVTASDPAHIVRVKAKWAEFVDKRRATKEK